MGKQGGKQSSVLIVSYLFPPIGGIGAQRPLKFVKYLHEFGWSVTVLTTKDAYSATSDPTLINEIPEEVRTVRVPDPISKLIGKTVSSSANRIVHQRIRVRAAIKKSLKKLLKKVKDTWLIPDEAVLWAIRAAWTGRKLVRKSHLDCIYTTSGPNSSHLVGLFVHWTTGVKWVADFRDPWVDNQHFYHRGIRRWLEAWLERSVFQYAESVITVTDGFRNLFENKYPNAKERIYLIRNGADPDDFPQNRISPFSLYPFTIFYAGILYPARSPGIFLQALSRLIRYAQIDPGQIRIQFAGVFDYPGHHENHELVKTLGLDRVVEVLGYLSHEEVLRRMNDAHALLLIGEKTNTAHLYIPGKLYEYLYTEKPILALLKEGEAADLIRDVHAGIVADPLSPEEVANAILKLYRDHQNGKGFGHHRTDLQKYTRRAQTQQLANLLNKVPVQS